MSAREAQMNVPRFVAIEDYAAQLVAALVVDGAVLDDRLIVRQATDGFSARFGKGGAIGVSFGVCLGETAGESTTSLVRRLSPGPALAPAIPPDAASVSAEAKADATGFVPFYASGKADMPAPPAPQVELSLERPDMRVRISPLFAPGGLRYGYLVQELPVRAVLPDPDPAPVQARGAPPLASSREPREPGSESAIAPLAEPLSTAGRRLRLPIEEIVPDAGPAVYQFLDRLSHGYWTHDLRTGARRFSDGWCRLRGIDPQQIVNESEVEWMARLHPDDRAATVRYHERLYAGIGDFEPIIYRERHAKGHWRTALVQSAVLERGPDGKPLLIAGSDVDVSATYSGEEYSRQMASLEQRWLIASEYGKLGLWDNDAIAGTRYVSHTWRQMRGYGPADVFDNSREALIERTHPDDRAALLEQIEATVNGGTDVVYQEYRERHRDGHYIWLLSRGRVISRDETGRASRIIGIDTDISEIKATNDEVVAMSRRLELALASTRVGVWEFDLKNHTVRWDRRMMEIYGLDLPASEMPANSWEERIHPEDRDRVVERADAMNRGEGPFWGQYRIIRPDGSIRYIRARSSDVHDNAGNSSLIGIDWDVTADVEAAEELRRAHALARQRNDELEKARAEMEHRALHDALTDLPNRRYLDTMVQELRGASTEIAVLQLDLDRFKQINDTLGHAAGDAVLCHVARVLRDEVPEGAMIARVGGDEFVILMAEAPNRCDLAGLANRIVAALQAPLDINGQDCRFGISVGIATGRMQEMTPEVILENADMALYEAKSAGRSRSVFFASRMRTAIEAKRLLADAVLGGLERNEFYCVYQPQFQAADLQISGVEALVRWLRPDGTVAMPGEFLGVAEELNVVERLDQVVLGQVLRDQAAWHDAGVDVPRVSVNVSARRLADPELPTMLRSLGIEKGRIAFELLETVFLDTPDSVITANIAAIRDMGIEIEIDDFGTGHASIVGMLRLQPDRIKIDQQLVRPLSEGEKQGQLVQSIIDIGRMHGIALIAEGVETAEHVRLLTAMGCQHLQGYGLGMPMTEQDLRSRLRTGEWEMTAA